MGFRVKVSVQNDVLDGCVAVLSRMIGSCFCFVCGTRCGEITFVMSLCHAVWRGMGGECVSVPSGRLRTGNPMA